MIPSYFVLKISLNVVSRRLSHLSDVAFGFRLIG